jgi:2-polyprenyl-6-methoxyphenol hydroxylase-like FAD-dependent oxidoreductase
LQQRYDGTAVTLGILPSGRDAAGVGPWLTLFWSERLDRMDAVRDRGWEAWRQAALHLWPGASEVIGKLKGFGDFTVAAYADVRVWPWTRGCVALFGDAAHGTSPQLGQGATLALLDAHVLARALGLERDVPSALLRFQRERSAHARYYQFASRMLTPLFQADGRMVGNVRDAIMGPFGALPIFRNEFLATLTGHKTGILFGRLDPLED